MTTFPSTSHASPALPYVRACRPKRTACALACALVLAGCSKKASPEAAPTATGSAPAAPAAEGPLKIAFAYVGPVGDAGWTYAHDRGRKAVEAEFGAKVSTSFVENVPEAADA